MRGLALCLALLATPVAAKDIDERWTRDGTDSAFSLAALKAVTGLQPFRRSIAVVIGIGDYTNGWNPLEAPTHDVQRVADFLKGQGAFDIVYTLTDGAATRERIRTLMVGELPQEVGPNDRVLFYFSGHGTQEKLFGNRVFGHLVLQDSGPDDYSSMIDMELLRSWWYRIAHARQSLFILDACFSGLGLQSKGDSVYDRTVADLSKRGHYLITAGTEDQLSYASLSRWGGSLFTTALIDGMKGRADSETVDAPRDGIVSLKELWDYNTKRIRAEIPSGDMTPQQAGFETTSEGEFFFVADPDAARTTVRGGGAVEDKGGDTILIDPKEMQLWNDVKDSGSAQDLAHFQTVYPDSVFAPLAESRRAALSAPTQPTALVSPDVLMKSAEPILTLAEQRYRAGLDALAKGRMPTAVQSFKTALAADPAHEGATLGLAQLFAGGKVNGRVDLQAGLDLLDACKTMKCKEYQSQLLDLQKLSETPIPSWPFGETK